MLEARCVCAVWYWQHRGSAFNTLWAAVLIMWILMQTEERHRAWEHFSSLILLTKTLLVPSPLATPLPFPSPSLSYYLHPLIPPVPSTQLHPPSPLQRMRGIPSILSPHQVAVASLPPPDTRDLPHLLYPTLPRQSEAALICIRVQPVSSNVCNECWSWDTYSTEARGSIRSRRSRGARVSRDARLTISAAGTRVSLE